MISNTSERLPNIGRIRRRFEGTGSIGKTSGRNAHGDNLLIRDQQTGNDGQSESQQQASDEADARQAMRENILNEFSGCEEKAEIGVMLPISRVR